ncbi:MAG: hypothetical protein Tsb0020_44660 [Haliangiales bacterium]
MDLNKVSLLLDLVAYQARQAAALQPRVGMNLPLAAWLGHSACVPNVAPRARLSATPADRDEQRDGHKTQPQQA